MSAKPAIKPSEPAPAPEPDVPEWTAIGMVRHKNGHWAVRTLTLRGDKVLAASETATSDQRSVAVGDFKIASVKYILRRP